MILIIVYLYLTVNHLLSNITYGKMKRTTYFVPERPFVFLNALETVKVSNGVTKETGNTYVLPSCPVGNYGALWFLGTENTLVSGRDYAIFF